jgi:predicted metal-dependent hydrolase
MTKKAEFSVKRLSFVYGSELIRVDRLQRDEGVNRVLIKVSPDCRVEVMAPLAATDTQVLGALRKRQRWIYEQLRDFRKQQEHVSSHAYVSGESHYYLGRQYLLKVLVDKAAEPGVKLFRGKLEVTIKEKDSEKVRLLLVDWYRGRAKEIFPTRLEAALEQTLWVKKVPALRVLAMKTQWGNCSPGGRLTLNPHLVKTPRECIDYVILHELCHLKEHNHSERFYRLLGRVMPGWEKTKRRLDDMAATVLA